MTGFQHFFRLLSPMARFFIPSTPQAGIPTFPIPTSLPSFERQILIMPIYANLTLGPDRKICPMISKPFDCDFQVCCENLSRIRLGWQLHYAPILHLCLLFLSCLRFAFPSCFVCPFFSLLSECMFMLLCVCVLVSKFPVSFCFLSSQFRFSPSSFRLPFLFPQISVFHSSLLSPIVVVSVSHSTPQLLP